MRWTKTIPEMSPLAAADIHWDLISHSPLLLVVGDKFLLLSVSLLRMQDIKSRMDSHFHKTSADFQLM